MQRGNIPPGDADGSRRRRLQPHQRLGDGALAAAALADEADSLPGFEIETHPVDGAQKLPAREPRSAHRVIHSQVFDLQKRHEIAPSGII
ncbi:hypothetical protein SDC9_120644 [bioreactor metagenome]|uniref:Uncharacterized protein n=1 Tax=bioreactor metagenome TaxID=1076179 RepID=A0A645C7I2_9ZZZZ